MIYENYSLEVSHTLNEDPNSSSIKQTKNLMHKFHEKHFLGYKDVILEIPKEKSYNDIYHFWIKSVLEKEHLRKLVEIKSDHVIFKVSDGIKQHYEQICNK